MAEAVEWVKRCPIRPILEAADFGDAMTPEVAEQEDRIREGAAGRDAGRP